MLKIRNLRKKAKMTQLELAKKVSVTQATIALWENGIVMPNAKKLPDIASALKCTVDELYGEG